MLAGFLSWYFFPQMLRRSTCRNEAIVIRSRMLAPWEYPANTMRMGSISIFRIWLIRYPRTVGW